MSQLLLGIFVAGGIVLIVWFAWLLSGDKPAEVSSFDECAAAGNPIQESYPEVCVTPDGTRYTNPDQQAEPLLQ